MGVAHILVLRLRGTPVAVAMTVTEGVLGLRKMTNATGERSPDAEPEARLESGTAKIRSKQLFFVLEQLIDF